MSDNYYERDFFIPAAEIQKFVHTLELFYQYKNIIKSFTVIYLPEPNGMFKATIRFFSGDDFKLFHNVIMTFLVGIKTEGVN